MTTSASAVGRKARQVLRRGDYSLYRVSGTTYTIRVGCPTQEGVSVAILRYGECIFSTRCPGGTSAGLKAALNWIHGGKNTR